MPKIIINEVVSDTASKTADDHLTKMPIYITKAAGAELTTDVPHHDKPRVQFAEDIAQVHVFNRHSETHNVAQNELWYTEIEYQQMYLAFKTEKKTGKRLALLRERRSSIDFTKAQIKKFANEHRKDALLSLEPKIIPPKYPVQYAVEVCSRMSKESDDLTESES